MRAKSLAVVASFLCFMMLISACSGASAPNNSASSGSDTAQTGSASQQKGEQAAASKFPRTIKDATGEVTIKEQPKKIAVVHWGYADSLLLFDLQSVGLALPFTEKQSVLHTDSYKPYVDKIKELKIVGENTKVNLEALLSYGPDLIIAGNAVNQDIAGELSRIAPTVMIDEKTTDVWSDWPSLVTKFGEILGQEETAERYISEYRANLQTAKEKLAGLDGTVAFLQVRDKMVWLQGTDYLKQYYEGMGLKPPVSTTIKEGEQLSLEGLSVVNPDYLFLGYFNYSDKSIPALTDDWESNPVWSKLKAVENKHVYGIDGQLALGYGPIGNSYGVKAVLEALSK